jgi:hypothetical protein
LVRFVRKKLKNEPKMRAIAQKRANFHQIYTKSTQIINYCIICINRLSLCEIRTQKIKAARKNALLLVQGHASFERF